MKSRISSPVQTHDGNFWSATGSFCTWIWSMDAVRRVARTNFTK